MRVPVANASIRGVARRLALDEQVVVAERGIPGRVEAGRAERPARRAASRPGWRGASRSGR